MVKSSPSLTPLEERKKQEWRAIRDHLQTWYAQPDLECLRAALSVYQSHFSDDAPIWMFLLGPPSTGKSELCVYPLTSQEQTVQISTITESSFISAYDPKCGILPNLNGKPKNGVLLFSDFSNFLALAPDVRSKLQAQMREIYDGKYQKHAGNQRTAIEWEGKVSILAACTPDLERYWTLENSLGDRFLQIRLKPPDPELIYPYMERQQQTGKGQLQKKTQRLIDQFLEDVNEHPEVEPPHSALNKYIFQLTNICVSLRQAVHHNYKGEATGVGTKEGTPRFARMAINLAKTHAKLFGRTELAPSDNRLLQRVLLDTCPSRRLALIQFLLNHSEAIPTGTINAAFPSIPYPSMRQLIDDLRLLQLVEVEKIFSDKFVTITPEFRDALLTARVPARLA
jgi:hypothetical protein